MRFILAILIAVAGAKAEALTFNFWFDAPYSIGESRVEEGGRVFGVIEGLEEGFNAPSSISVRITQVPYSTYFLGYKWSPDAWDAGSGIEVLNGRVVAADIYFKTDDWDPSLYGTLSLTTDLSYVLGYSGYGWAGNPTTFSAVPVPASLPLLLGAIGYLGFRARKKRGGCTSGQG